MLKRFCLLNLIFSVLLISVPVTSQIKRGVQVREKPIAQTEKRTALVIGNGAYQNTTQLQNPVNDATDVAAALRKLGFEVLFATNADKRQMEKLMREFGFKLEASKGVGLFYYAGHGLQMNGENYLLPVEADIPAEDEVKHAGVSLGFVLDKMESAKNSLNLVILDACRNNPFARSWRNYRDVGDNKGLAKISPETGMLVLYATGPGKVASDGTERNGLFTEALLKHILKPNLEYDQMVRAVSADVWQKSNKKQLPWKEGNTLQEFYFAKTGTNNQPGERTQPEVSFVEKDRAAIEREAWLLVGNGNSANDIRAFLQEFPNGANAGKAKIRLEQLAWDSVKNSNDKAKVKAYLDEFPNGASASIARIKLRQLETVSAPITTNNSETDLTINSVPKSNNSVTVGTVRKNSIGMELVYIPAGEFMMGSESGKSDQKPVHKVSIKEGFWMGKYEVSIGEWKKLMSNIPKELDKAEAKFKESDEQPIIYVSWNDAKEFIAKLNAKNDGFEYGLPSEAQWEYAARAGTNTKFAFGDSLNTKQFNNSDKTVPVGSYKPNSWSLYDMHGNVAEWIEDVYAYYDTSLKDESPNKGITYWSERIIRGGSYNALVSDSGGYNPEFDDDKRVTRLKVKNEITPTLESAYRDSIAPDKRLKTVGFRVMARLK